MDAIEREQEAKAKKIEHDLRQPIITEGDEAYQSLANEAGKRVWTVLQNLIAVRCRNLGTQSLTGADIRAVLMGAMSGIATQVARMELGVDGDDPDAMPAEILLLNDLGNQFIHTIEQMRQSDPIARMMVQGDAANGDAKPS
jgi:hypothetical protein